MIQRDGALPSLWQATTDNRSNYIPDRVQSRNNPFDVIIAGGGIAGVSTALHLQEAGFRCAILEAATLCFGTTGGTTAHLNTIMDTPYTTLSRNFGKQGAALVAQAAAASIRLIKTNCEKYAIDAQFEEQTAYIFSQNDQQTQQLAEMRQASLEAGVAMEYTDILPVSMPKQKAVAVRGQAKFHPTRYVLGMARAFQRLGGRIVEQCRVQRSTEDDSGVTVHTDLGEFKCTHLIYATHIPPGMSLLDTRCAPYRSYVLAVTLKGDYPDGLIYDLNEPYHYYRTQVIDGQPYLIAGGEDHKTGHDSDTQARFLRLAGHVRKCFDVEKIRYHWSSQFYESVDGLPYIGDMPGEPGHRYVATGFGGNGMIYGGVAAMVFRSMLLQSVSSAATATSGQASEPVRFGDEFTKLFDPNRLKPVAGFSNFVRENTDVLKKWIGKLLPADKLKQLADLAPGEGRVVKFEGETIALYKTDDDELRALGPTCPHMGCHVAWNSAEKTWDCPCHGARYAIDGTMVTGPAAHDLERIDVASLINK